MTIEEKNHATTLAKARFHRYGEPENKKPSHRNKHLSKLDDLISLNALHRLINKRIANIAPLTSRVGSQEVNTLNIIIPTSLDKDYIKFMGKLSRKLKAELASTELYQESTFSNLYNQIHEIATKHPEANIRFILAHNRFIKPIWSYLDKHPEMMPRNTILDVWYYSGYEMNSCDLLFGRGPIDKRHCETMEHISNAEKINDSNSTLDNQMAPTVTPENLISYLSADLADALKRLRDNPSLENKNKLVAITKDLLTKITVYLPSDASSCELTYLANCLTNHVTRDDFTTIKTIVKERKIWSGDMSSYEMRFISMAIAKALLQQEYKHTENSLNELKKNLAAEISKENLAAVEKLKRLILARTESFIENNNYTPHKSTRFKEDCEGLWRKAFETSQENKPTTTRTILEIFMTIVDYIAKLIKKLTPPLHNKVIKTPSLFSPEKNFKKNASSTSPTDNGTEEIYNNNIDVITRIAIR